MKVLNIYIKNLDVLMVVVYRMIHGRYVKHCYANPYNASVQRIQKLTENHYSKIEGEGGVLILTFSF